MGPLTATQPRFNHWLRLTFIALGVGMLSLIPLYLSTLSDGGAAPAALPGEDLRIAYVEFGRASDTVWLASAANPQKREPVLSIEHALEFGAVPSLSPDGKRLAYTALPPNLKAPSAETPAGLWLASLEDGTPPEALAANVDLLVKPLWRPDGAGLVVRRSTASTLDSGHFRLVYVDLETRTERDIAFANGAALFPIAFTPGGNELLVARLSTDASDLLSLDLQSGAVREVGLLAAGLTRDWSLSPAGDGLAYLEMSLAGSQVRSRAFVLDLATGVRRPVTDGAGDDFAPIWTKTGALTIGRAGANGAGSGLLTLRPGEDATLAPSARGFDVPLGASPTAEAIAVRSFDGASALAPGRPVLALVRTDGDRTTIAGGEVTFLGWTNP